MMLIYGAPSVIIGFLHFLRSPRIGEVARTPDTPFLSTSLQSARDRGEGREREV